jgi:hypothetical protein
MTLPVPNAEEVDKFKALYLKHREEELDNARALDLATRFLQLIYFATTKPPEPSAERKAEIAQQKAREARRLERLRRQGRIGIRPAPENDARDGKSEACKPPDSQPG